VLKACKFIYSAACPLSWGVSSILGVVFLSVDLALNRACLFAKGVFANSLEEADADVGFVGVLLGGVLVVGVDLEDSGVRAVGVGGLEVGVAAFTLAALASRRRLVLVGRGASFILRAVGLGEGAVEFVTLVSGFVVVVLGSVLRLRVALEVAVVLAGVVDGLVAAVLLVVVDVGGLADTGLVVDLVLPKADGFAGVALSGRVVGFGPVAVVGFGAPVDDLTVVDAPTLGLVVGAFVVWDDVVFPADFGVVFDSASVVGGLGDFLLTLAAAFTADLATLAISSAGTFSVSLTSSTCGF